MDSEYGEIEELGDCQLKGFYSDCMQDKDLCPDCLMSEGKRNLYLSPDSYREND
jgi:hypothetical protein